MMIRLSMILGIARAEARLTRRLVRYWIFMVLATLVGFYFYGVYSLLHYFFSSASATVGSLNPRFVMSDIGFRYLFVFLVGVIFLGMDVRSRDVRERMAGVLDTLPCTNLELVLGKYLGVLIPSWIPLVLAVLTLWAAGFLWGGSIQPHTLIYLLLLMAIPVFTLIIGITYCVLLLVKHRGAAAVLLLLIMAGIYAGWFFSPVWLAPATDMTGAVLNSFPSDIIPEVVTGEGLVHRIAIMLMGLGFLWMAAGFHPRKDDNSLTRYVGVGLLMIFGAMVILGGIVYVRKSGLDQRLAWKAAHEVRLADSAPDLTSITGNVVVDPGESLARDLEIGFMARQGGPLDNALFTLNPGIVVSEATDGEGRPVTFTQENGLLDFRLNDTLPAGGATIVRFRAEGMPEEFFGYLDGTKDPISLTLKDASLIILGYIPAIFQDNHVTMLPGARWLPMSGVDVGQSGFQSSPTDFFLIDLTVAVPEGWVAALPGRRQEVESDRPGMDMFRFTPGAPVDQVALIAGEYLARSMEVSGVQAEILMHPSHDSNLEVFSDSITVMEAWMAEKLDEAAAMGLPYPYDAIRIVEVPNAVRGFGGGWRLGSTLSPSATILMKESGFPMARFDVKFQDPSRFDEMEGGMPAAKIKRLETFFDNDFNGGNLFAATARNFFTGLTAGEGVEGLPLDFVFEELSSRLVIGRHTYFSAYLFTPDMQSVVGQTIAGFMQSGQERSFLDTLVESVTSRASVWDKTLSVSLDQLDPWEKPMDTLDILTLKGGAMAQSMIDDLGREETGAFLAALRERGEGGSYTRDDVLAAGEAAGADLTPWLDTWIAQTDLPGFMVSEDAVEAYRLEDSEEGSSRYQMLVRIRNGEAVPGLLRVEYEAGRGEETERGDSGPVKIPAGGSVEIGLVSSQPPNNVRVVPYLSLNRAPFTLGFGSIDNEDLREGEPFNGSREIARTERDTGIILVDDLDPRFEVDNGSTGSGLRVKGTTLNIDTDQGLPVRIKGQGLPSEWSREVTPEAFGKYRHTFALVKTGSGSRKAIFTAEIPSAGAWDLEVHFPKEVPLLGRSIRDGAKWSYIIKDDSGDQETVLDIAGAEDGWNYLGSFELAGGETRVILDDQAEGRVVIADAIRWVPASGALRTESSEE